MAAERILVVGASLAGLRAAQAARAAGFDGELMVVGAERHPPYTRPPLSKALLAGEQTGEQCALPCRNLEVEWLLDSAASELDRTNKRVRLEGGDRLSYDRMIIATGCRARPWRGAGAALEGVHTLRTIDDALALQAALEARPRLLVVGAGFLGCEVAATARGRGLEVTVVDIAAHPMLPLGAELGKRCARLHREHGVDLRCGTGIEVLHGRDRVEAATLSDGSRVEADAVLFALGAVSNIEWLAGSGLADGSGVACDATLTARADPDILAAGDVAAWPHALAGGAQVRVEHWTTAAEHGQLAGANVLKEPEARAAAEAPPYFWSDQYDVKIQSVGFPNLCDELELLESTPGGERFIAAGARDGRLVAVVAWNAAKRLTWYRRQLLSPPAFEELKVVVAGDQTALGAPAGALA